MYEADISKATVLALFLLPENLRRLEPKFRALPAGTRIVVNTFGIPEEGGSDRNHRRGLPELVSRDAVIACLRAPISWISHALTTVRLSPREG